jgi:hypothetical protein
MTRHERCSAAIAGRPVDRPPRYVPGIACEVASRILGRKAYGGTGSLHYAEACAWTGGQAAHDEFEEALYRDLADLYRALDIDVFRMPWRMTAPPARRLDELSFLYGDPDGAHTVYKYSPATGDFGPIFSSTAQEPDVEAFEREVAGSEQAVAQGALDRLELPDEHVRICRRFGREFFVVFNGGGIGVGLSAERLLLLGLAGDLMRRDLMVQARHGAAMGALLARSAYPRVMIGGLDLAGNAGPMYSPATFRHVTLPACRWLMERLRPLGVHYVFRSDGVLWPISDMLFVEAGIDGYGEVDREVGMTVAAVRKRYPRLVLWGNFSSSFLARATPGEVRDEARRIVDESGPTGYFHGCSNAILQGTPAENVLAMFSP